MGNACSGNKERTTYLDSAEDGGDNESSQKSLHGGSIRDLAFVFSDGSQPDGCLMSCSDDGTMISSSVSNLLASVDATKCSFSGHKKGINKMSVMGGHLWSASRDLSVKQWDATSGCCLQTLPDAHELNIAALDTHAAHGQVASGSRDYSVKLWDVETGKCQREFSARRNVVTCMAYAGKHAGAASVLYQGGEDLCVRAWDCRTSEGAATGGATPSLVMGGYVYFPTSMCVAPGSAHLLATGCKGFNGSGAEVKCWDARQPAKPLVEFLGHTHDVTACTFVHVGQGVDLRAVDGFADAVLSCSKDGSVGLWNTITKQKMAFSSGMNKHFTSLAVLPCTSSGAAFDFAIGAYDGSLLLCSVVTAPQSGSPKTLPFSIVVNSSTAPYVSSMTENDIINRS